MIQILLANATEERKKREVGGNAGFNWDHYALKTNATLYWLLYFNSTVQNLEEKNQNK